MQSISNRVSVRTVLLSLAGAVLLGAIPLVANAQRGPNSEVSSVQPRQLGIVEAPVAGSTEIALEEVPAVVLHSAQVAFKTFDGVVNPVSAQLDADEIVAVYEILGQTRDGRILEADIRADATLEELEIEISGGEVPQSVWNALREFAPNFQATAERPLIEKSVRPTAAGLSEIWYEFGGSTFDVEIRSDGRSIVIEPA